MFFLDIEVSITWMRNIYQVIAKSPALTQNCGFYMHASQTGLQCKAL